MRSKATEFSLSLLFLPISAIQIAPFYPAFSLDDTTLVSNETSIPEPPDLLKRANNCPTSYGSCSTSNAAWAGACCSSGSVCTTDNARNIACCAVGATCTGSISGPTAATTTTGGGAVFGSTTASSTDTITTTSPTGTASYVDNPYFPFPYIPTSYANSAACNSAFTDCQNNYAACTNGLEGLAFGVTISAPQGGVTVAPSLTNVGVASATSICSSLSSVGCYGIVSGNCAQFGTGTTSGGGFDVGSTNVAPRPTMGCMAVAGMMAGVGLGIAGQLV